jgi:protein-S-isoprenylcysteine O-methyltransferase Ste14
MNLRQPTPPVFFLFSILLMFMMHANVPGFVMFTGSASYIIGIMFIGFGLATSVWSGRTLKKAGTTTKPWEEPTAFVKTGPFSYCRNPTYLGMVIALFGFFFLLGSSTSLITVLLFGGIIEDKFIRHEEKIMTQKFGKEYIEYTFKVSKWFPLLTDFAYEKTKKGK